MSYLFFWSSRWSPNVNIIGPFFAAPWRSNWVLQKYICGLFWLLAAPRRMELCWGLSMTWPIRIQFLLFICFESFDSWGLGSSLQRPWQGDCSSLSPHTRTRAPRSENTERHQHCSKMIPQFNFWHSALAIHSNLSYITCTKSSWETWRNQKQEEQLLEKNWPFPVSSRLKWHWSCR